MMEALLDWDGRASAMRLRESRLMRTVNTAIRRQTGPGALFDSIAFFCECRDSSCHQVVWMSAAAFDEAMSDRSSWLLREGHEPSASWHPRGASPTRKSRRVPLRAVPAADLEPLRPIVDLSDHAIRRALRRRSSGRLERFPSPAADVSGAGSA